jgi:hypothetical protein
MGRQRLAKPLYAGSIPVAAFQLIYSFAGIKGLFDMFRVTSVAVLS